MSDKTDWLKTAVNDSRKAQKRPFSQIAIPIFILAAYLWGRGAEGIDLSPEAMERYMVTFFMAALMLMLVAMVLYGLAVLVWPFVKDERHKWKS